MEFAVFFIITLVIGGVVAWRFRGAKHRKLAAAIRGAQRSCTSQRRVVLEKTEHYGALYLWGESLPLRRTGVVFVDKDGTQRFLDPRHGVKHLTATEFNTLVGELERFSYHYC